MNHQEYFYIILLVNICNDKIRVSVYSYGKVQCSRERADECLSTLMTDSQAVSQKTLKAEFVNKLFVNYCRVDEYNERVGWVKIQNRE